MPDNDQVREYIARHRDQITPIHQDPSAWSRLLDSVAAKLRPAKAQRTKSRAQLAAEAQGRTQCREEALYSKLFGGQK